MTPEARALAQALYFLPLLLSGMLAFAVIQRYRGRAVPSWLGWLGLFLLGLGLGPGLVLSASTPIWLLLAGIPIVLVSWLFIRSGRFRWAGFFLVGLGVPGVLWWALPPVQAAIPVHLLTPDARLAWLPSVCVLVMGIGLVIVGDRTDEKPRIVATPPGLARDPMTVGHELYRTIAFGPLTLPGIVSEGIGFGVLALGLPAAVSAGLPWFLAILAGAATFMLIATEGWYLAMPRDVLRAWEGFAVVGHPEQERWKQRTGDPVPNTKAKIDAWLRDHDVRPELYWGHAEMLAFVGRLDEAQSIAARIEPANASEAHELQALVDYMHWLDGDDMDIDGLSSAAERVGDPGSPERLEARGRVAIAAARERAVAGGDWMEPLVTLRQEAGPIAGRWFRQDTRPGRLVTTFLFGLALATVIVLSALSISAAAA